MLSIGFESISRDTLKSVHKHVNRPETFAALVEKVHSYGIMVFGLFMFGFDGDDTLGVRPHRRLQHRRQIRRLRLFDAHALPRHADLVRDEEGRTASSRSTGRCTTRATSSTGRRRCRATSCASDRSHAYGNSIPAASIASRFPLARQTPSRAMDDLQSVHAARRRRPSNIEFDRGADGGARRRADAADPADQARMARRRAGSRRRPRSAHDIAGTTSDN